MIITAESFEVFISSYHEDKNSLKTLKIQTRVILTYTLNHNLFMLNRNIANRMFTT